MDHIRTYRVGSLHEALQRIRDELGPEAAVLHTREVRGGWWGWRTELEVTASAEVEIPCRLEFLDSSSAVNEPPRPDNCADHPRPLEATAVPASPVQPVRTAYVDDGSLDLTRDPLRPLRANVRPAPPAALRASDDEAVFPADVARLQAEIAIAGPIRVPRDQSVVVAVVGPTGVGKTTTLAKLAAQFRLEQDRRVGLITVDTYRVGAVDQLRTYAQIMELPLEVVSSPREMREAVERLRGCELILIDTAGRNPKDRLQMRELNALLAAANPAEVHLVASANAEVEGLVDTTDRFVAVGANRLLLTKTDEVTRPGRLLRYLGSSPLPLGYVTNGQNVPADIRRTDPRRLAEWLLDRRDAKEL